MERYGKLPRPQRVLVLVYVRASYVDSRTPTQARNLAALQLGNVTDPDFGGARLEFRSVWFGSRLISPSVMAHNAVPIALRPRCIRRSDWSSRCIHTRTCCLYKTHIHTHTHNAWVYARARTHMPKRTTANCRIESWGGSIRGEAIDFGAPGFVPISSNPQQLASLHKNNTAARAKTRTSAIFRYQLADAVGRFLSSRVHGSMFPDVSFIVAERIGCFACNPIVHPVFTNWGTFSSVCRINWFASSYSSGM